MRNIFYVICCLALMFVSCNNNEEKSDAYGNFEVDDLLVAAEGQGRLVLFSIEEGATLEPGFLVGVIDTMQFYLKKEQIEAGIKSVGTKTKTLLAQVESQRVQLKNLEREYNRLMNMLEDGAATKKQTEDMEGNIELLKSQIMTTKTQQSTLDAEKQSLQIQIRQIDDQIAKSKIINPIGGVVLQKYKQQGELVVPGQSLYKIASLEKLILRVYLSGSQLSQIAIGEEVTVRIDGTSGIEELPGRVSWVSSRAEFTPKIIQTREERVNLVYAVKVEVKNDGRLKIGMPGEIKLR